MAGEPGDREQGRTRLVSQSVSDGDFTHVIETRVGVPPDVAFGYVSDIRRHPEWSMNPVTIRAAGDGVPGLGARYWATGRQAGRDWPSELVVTAFEPPERFAFTASGGPIGTTADRLHRHEFRLTPAGGGTRIVVTRVDPIPDLRTRVLRPLVTRFAVRVRLRTIERLRARIDALESA